MVFGRCILALVPLLSSILGTTSQATSWEINDLLVASWSKLNDALNGVTRESPAS